MFDLLPRPRRIAWLVVLVLVPIVGCWDKNDPPSAAPPPAPADLDKQLNTICSHCHAYPPADTFPRSAWKEEVEQAYRFAADAKMPTALPPIDSVIKYFEERAPEQLPAAVFEKSDTPLPVTLRRSACPLLPLKEGTAISNVNLVHLSDPKKFDVLACEMRTGRVLRYKPYEENPSWQVLAEQSHPAHAEVVDLDGDGIKDIVVANLGSFTPTDRRAGSVVWLRGKGDGTFTPITLLDKVGRVADVQAADFNGDGKMDLIVAVFGWRETGEIIYLENQTTDWDHPIFVPHTVDSRHGTIHVPVVDLDGDGKPDFVALISQEHEIVVAFLNDGQGHFRKETIYEAPHPGYGSSGIQLVDMNGDGNIDLLYTNGDVLDKPYILKPYHSIQWLENPGRGQFPWKHHPLTPLYGVHRAIAADFCGNGRMDVIGVSFLPKSAFPQRSELKLDSIILLEQTEKGEFVRRTVEAADCDYVSCVAGDLYGSGRPDLVVGHFDSAKGELLSIWKNLGKTGK
jgi:FG-GAP-like repeat